MNRLFTRSNSDSSSDDSIWLYTPSFPLAIVAAILYMIPTTAQLHLSFFYRGPKSAGGTGNVRHRYFVCVLIGTVLEVAGYAIRAVSTKELSSIPTYATSQSLIVIAPLFVAASLYMLIARLIPAMLPPSHQSFYRISPRWLAKIFVASDIISFLTQASGSAIASSGNWAGSSVKTGEHVLIGGLALQVATFTFFMVLVWAFHRRARVLGSNGDSPEGWKHVLTGVYASGALVFVRSVYRLIEFALGIHGYPFTHEWIFYVLESMPMLGAISLLCWYHPVRFLPGMSRKAAKMGGVGAVELEEGAPESGREGRRGKR